MIKNYYLISILFAVSVMVSCGVDIRELDPGLEKFTGPDGKPVYLPAQSGTKMSKLIPRDPAADLREADIVLSTDDKQLLKSARENLERWAKHYEEVDYRDTGIARLADEVVRIRDKNNREGEDSLSPEEQAFLFGGVPIIDEAAERKDGLLNGGQSRAITEADVKDEADGLRITAEHSLREVMTPDAPTMQCGRYAGQDNSPYGDPNYRYDPDAEE